MTPSGRRVAVVLVAFLLIIAGGLSIVDKGPRNSPIVADQTPAEKLAQLPVAPPPPMTKHMAAVLESSQGFTALVSYTDNGFEPASLAISKGQTVRFTNNSTHTMWIQSSGGAKGVYPADEKSCGQSALDTCVALPPNDIWEFTFKVDGSWSYKNAAKPKDTGVINVQ